MITAAVTILPQAWRDLYSLATLLETCLKLRQQHAAISQTLPPASAADPHPQQSLSAAATAAAAHMRELDMGVLMGGPRFRHLLDGAIACMQRRCRQHEGASCASSGAWESLGARKRARLNSGALHAGAGQLVSSMILPSGLLWRKDSCIHRFCACAACSAGST